MRIKEPSNFKFPRLMFHSIFSNFMFVVILSFWFINSILFLVDYPFLGLIPTGLITFGLIAVFLCMVGGPGEAFSSDSPKENFQDFRRAIVYMIISLGIFVGLHYYNKEEPKKIVLVKEQSIPIKSIEITDVHHNKIMYELEYKDSNGSIRWKNKFPTDEDRQKYLDTLVKDGKFKVGIFFHIDTHNNGSLSVVKKTIKDNWWV